MEPPSQAGSISHGRVHIPSLLVATGPRGHVRTPSLGTWGLSHELSQNNKNEGDPQKYQPEASLSTGHRTNPSILLSGTSLKAAACVYLTCMVLRKIILVSVIYASIS